ncbi:PEGA domain-containing protein [uncultured Thiodictyon sp.]|uniref:PEGA domain-containing protein n=1 Tax=uncultured Thiodictyon sp. TaxID=1846217 RepID=UPI0025FE7F8D|nr:PEGA domain-containing protein [uncultured Thiodictyon sp.]
MTSGPKIALVMALATLAGGCATANLDCSAGPKPRCDAADAHCVALPDPCRYIPPGASNDLVAIDSSPTPADIYVDGDYVGKTPLKRYLWFSSNTRAVTVVAQPLYPGQARQEQHLQVPPLPKRLTFFMNNPAKTNEAEAEAAAAVR